MDSSRGRRPAHLQVLAVAWNFGWPIASGVLLGYWLDQRLGTSPALTLGFSVGAMGASVQRLLQLSARERAEAAASQAAGAPETAGSATPLPAAAAPTGADEEAEPTLNEEKAEPTANEEAEPTVSKHGPSHPPGSGNTDS